MKLVVAGFIVCQNKVLLIFHKRKQKWLPVGGHVEDKENFDQALLREIKEEINLEPKIISYSPLEIKSYMDQLASPFLVSVRDETTIIEYVCSIDDLSSLSIQEEELEQAKLFSKEDLESDSSLDPTVVKKALFALNFLAK